VLGLLVNLAGDEHLVVDVLQRQHERREVLGDRLLSRSEQRDVLHRLEELLLVDVVGLDGAPSVRLDELLLDVLVGVPVVVDGVLEVPAADGVLADAHVAAVVSYLRHRVGGVSRHELR